VPKYVDVVCSLRRDDDLVSNVLSTTLLVWVYHFSPAHNLSPGFLDGVLRAEGNLLDLRVSGVCAGKIVRGRSSTLPVTVYQAC
jgi:hypothetical protein